MSFVIGLDVGGTAIKGIIFKDGEAVYKDSVPTVCGGLEECAKSLIGRLIHSAGAKYGQLSGVGAGCPGVIDADSGAVVEARNLGLENYPLKDVLEKLTGAEARVCNDANAAALGEARFGAGKNYKSSVFVTIGTGVGGGIIWDGKLFTGNKSAGAEIGHMVIKQGGKLCSCGRRGCFEAYCSARALAGLTRGYMIKYPSSAMWKKYTAETADGQTAFEFMDVDAAAKKAVRAYIKYLVCGIANIANVLRPEAVILGGGISAQGARLEKLVKDGIRKEIYAFGYAPVEVKCASLQNDAGSYGAAALFFE